MSKIYKILWFATHPTQYQSPLLKKLSSHPQLEIKVIFFSDFSINPYFDKRFKQVLKWDINMLDGLDYEFLRENEKKEISFLYPILPKLKKIIKNSEFNYIFVQGWQHHGMVYIAYLAKKYKKKVLMRCEASDEVKSTNNFIKKFIRNHLIKYYFSKINIFYAIGTLNKNFYLKRGINESSIGLMPYCVDNQKFSKKLDKKKNWIKKIGINPDKPSILYVGKLSERKNVKLLLQAYNQLKKQKPNLLIVGTGEKQNDLKQYCVENQLDQVKFLGFQNQGSLPEIYAGSDIFVLPSVDEPWGLVVNEAMSANCAIITTRHVGSACDLVCEDYNGVILEHLTVENLKNALIKCLEPKNLRLFQKNSGKLITKFSFETNLNGLLEKLSHD